MYQQDSFGNMFQRRMVNSQSRVRSIEPSYPIRVLDFTTGNGKGHVYDWNMHTLKFDPRSCFKPTCKVCGTFSNLPTKEMLECDLQLTT